MYKAAMQLAREASVEELLGNLADAQKHYINAKLLIEAVMITVTHSLTSSLIHRYTHCIISQATDPNDRRNLLFYAKEFNTCQTVCSQSLK